MTKQKETEHELEQLVASKLQEAGFKFKSQPIIGHANPDFLIETSEGQNIVLEVKKWSDSPDNIARAAHQAKRYKELTKAAAAFVVLPGLSEAMIPLGVLPLTGLATNLATALSTISKRSGKKMEITIGSRRKKIFAAMPFAPKYDDTFLVAMQPATIDAGAVCERVDHTSHYGDVVTQIKDMISNSSVMIADLSESRPNVCYEIGLAEAQEKPVIQICSTDFEKLPFDLRNNSTIKYSIGQASRLQKRLITELKKIFK